MNPEPELEPELDVLLQKLQQSPPRDLQRAARARNAFLAEAGQIAARVSNLAPDRLNRWQERFGAIWFTARKEKRKVFNFGMTLLLAVGVVFGGATTVAAAQGAQPNDALYFVKTWSEDFRLGWETDSQSELGLALQFTERRAEEIRTMLEAGGVVPATVLNRYENQEQQVLRVAAGMPNDLAIRALERVRDRARQQEHQMAQLQLSEPSAIQTCARVRTMLQTQAQIAQAGIENPEALREQLRLRDRSQVGLGTPLQGLTNGTEAAPSGSNPWTTGVPTPGSSYGPGASQNPWTDTTPVPGSGYGPGPGTGDCAYCTPQPGYESPSGRPDQGGGGPKGP